MTVDSTEVYISIHAPTRGATLHVANCYNDITFQSTLPREERRFRTKTAREDLRISIHAPTRGATQEGIISTTKILEDGKSVRRYDLVPTIQAYVKYLSDKAYGKQHRTDKEIELREQKMQADIALKESQGELHRLKTEIAAGQYISVEEVKLDYAKFFVVFKKFAMSIPARVTGMLSGQMEPSELRRCEKEIAAEVNRLLGAFVIAGIVGPEDVKKDGTLKEEKNTDS